MTKLVVDYNTLRSKLHRRQKAVARLLGMTEQTISGKMNGKTDWKLEEINRLAEVAQIPVSDFIKIE